jgi:hypothetical protein
LNSTFTTNSGRERRSSKIQFLGEDKTRTSLRKEVSLVAADVSLAKLQRLFASDRRVSKEIAKVHRYANAYEAWRSTRSEASRTVMDVALVDLRDALGEVHFQRVSARITRMIEGAEDVALR